MVRVIGLGSFIPDSAVITVSSPGKVYDFKLLFLWFELSGSAQTKV